MPYRLLVRAASRATGRLGWLRGAAGALAGIGLAGAVTHFALDPGPGALWLIGPVGASAVLVFALPASPLAQPWPVIGGNVFSVMVGLIMAALVPYPPLAAALAVGLAIATMALLRCLHPPGGACALLGALTPPTAGGAALLGPLMDLALPLAVNLAVMLAVAWAWNNLTGHRWPHDPALAPAPSREEWTARYEPADLDAVLEHWDEVLDVSRDDLDALFRAVEKRVETRWRA